MERPVSCPFSNMHQSIGWRLVTLAHYEYILRTCVLASSQLQVPDELGAHETLTAAQDEGVSVFHWKLTLVHLYTYKK